MTNNNQAIKSSSIIYFLVHETRGTRPAQKGFGGGVSVPGEEQLRAQVDDHLEDSQEADRQVETSRRDLQLTTVHVITLRPDDWNKTKP